jgi:hypothetical protein
MPVSWIDVFHVVPRRWLLACAGVRMLLKALKIMVQMHSWTVAAQTAHFPSTSCSPSDRFSWPWHALKSLRTTMMSISLRIVTTEMQLPTCLSANAHRRSLLLKMPTCLHLVSDVKILWIPTFPSPRVSRNCHHFEFFVRLLSTFLAASLSRGSTNQPSPPEPTPPDANITSPKFTVRCRRS